MEKVKLFFEMMRGSPWQKPMNIYEEKLWEFNEPNPPHNPYTCAHRNHVYQLNEKWIVTLKYSLLYYNNFDINFKWSEENDIEIVLYHNTPAIDWIGKLLCWLSILFSYIRSGETCTRENTFRKSTINLYSSYLRCFSLWTNDRIELASAIKKVERRRKK